MRKSLSPTNMERYVPKKYRVIIFPKMWEKPSWIKRLVRIVQGSLVKDDGRRPKRSISSGSKEVNMNRITLAASKNHNAFRLKP